MPYIIREIRKDGYKEYTEYKVSFGKGSSRLSETIGYSVYSPEAALKPARYDLFDKNWDPTCSTAYRSSLVMDLLLNHNDEDLCFIKNPDNIDNSKFIASAGNLPFEQIFVEKEKGHYDDAEGQRISFEKLIELIFNCSLTDSRKKKSDNGNITSDGTKRGSSRSHSKSGSVIGSIWAIGLLFGLISLGMVLPSIHEFFLEHHDMLLYVSGIVIRFVLIPVGTLICFMIVHKNDSSQKTVGIRLTVILFSLFIFTMFSISFGVFSYEVLVFWDSSFMELIIYKFIPEKILVLVIGVFPWAIKFVHSIVIAISIKSARKKESESLETGLFSINVFTTIILVCLFLFNIWCGFLPVFGVGGVIGLLLLFSLLTLLAAFIVNLPVELLR